jgi:hypothetical protein
MAQGHDADGSAKDDATGAPDPKGAPTSPDVGDDDYDDDSILSRRSALKVAGVGALAGISSSLLGDTASAATVYDAVDDLGWDPTGSDPVEGSLADAYGSNVTIQVPPGDYRVSSTAFLGGSASNFTLEGTGSSHKDVQFVADKGFHGKFFEVWGNAGPHTLRNFSLQQHDDTETSVSFTCIVSDGLLIEDVEHLGFTPDDGSGSAGFQMAVGVENRSGTGTIRRYYNREGGQILTYPDRQAGCWVGGSHSGVLTLEDCVFIELGGSCIYGTRHNGTVRVEGGYFANNDHHDMRISNERSDKLGWVRDAVFFGDYSILQSTKADAHEGGEGTWIEHGTDDLLIENCDYWYRDPYPTKYSSGYSHFPGIVHVPGYTGYGGDVTFRNCRLRNDVTEDSNLSGPSLNMSALNGSLTVENSHFTGGSPRSSVVADYGEVRDTVIDMPNGGDVSGGISTSNIASSGATQPSLAGLADVYPNVSSIDGDGGTGDSTGDNTDDSTDDTTSLPNIIELEGTGVTANYEFTVSEELQRTDSVESWDDVSGSTVNGYVTETSDYDAFEFSGEVTDFAFLEGDATVYVNGTEVDPSTLGASTLDRSIRLQGTGVTANYEFTVSGDLEEANDSLQSWDDVSGSTATGYVTETSHEDGFNFSGEVTDFTFLQGEADVYVDGTQVDPSTLGDTASDTQLPNSLSIDGSGTGQSTYAVSVDGELEADAAAGTVEDADAVNAASAEGTVDGDADDYRFSGSIVGFDLEGDATVSVNGSEVDPATVGFPNLVAFDGSATSGESTYEFAVTGDLVPDPLLGAVEDADTVDASSATGTVTDGADGFRFAGDLSHLRVDGNANVRFEDNDG